MEKKILKELDDRIKRIEETLKDPIENDQNEFEQLNEALSKVIGNALRGELYSIKEYIESL